MYGKDIIVIGAASGRLGFGRIIRLLTDIPVVNGDFVVDHLGFVDYVEPIIQARQSPVLPAIRQTLW